MSPVRALDPYRSATGLDAWEAIGLLSLGRPRTFSQGDVLLAHGQASSQAALITSGLVKVAAVDQGSATFLAIRSAGDLIGEEAAVLGATPQASGSPSSLTVATALTRATARVFPAADLCQFLEAHPSAMRSVAQGLCERLADAEARIASAARDNADRRLARFLCDLERYGIPDGTRGREGMAIPVRLTQAELASWIGASRETVDRALRRWRARGIVSTSQRKMVIHDVEALARIAGVNVSRRPAVRSGARHPDRQATVDTLREKLSYRAPEPTSGIARQAGDLLPLRRGPALF